MEINDFCGLLQILPSVGLQVNISYRVNQKCCVRWNIKASEEHLLRWRVKTLIDSSQNSS